jgi:hypothetical protein
MAHNVSRLYRLLALSPDVSGVSYIPASSLHFIR